MGRETLGTGARPPPPLSRSASPQRFPTTAAILNASPSPAGNHHLFIGIELDRILPVRLEIAEERPFRTSEGEERHGRRDAEVHPDHAHPHPVAELASRPPRGGEDRRGVPIARALD